jgi:hypothetical protein
LTAAAGISAPKTAVFAGVAPAVSHLPNCPPKKFSSGAQALPMESVF